jgi:hypothetical protein
MEILILGDKNSGIKVIDKNNYYETPKRTASLDKFFLSFVKVLSKLCWACFYEYLPFT